MIHGKKNRGCEKMLVETIDENQRTSLTFNNDFAIMKWDFEYFMGGG